MKRHLFLFVVLIAFAIQSFASTSKRGFAIVIDPESYKEAKTQVNAYAGEIEKTGLKVFYVMDRYGIPDSLRKELQNLYRQKEAPIEGAVLIGDIPIAMIRDAQHLTSAFKMDQKTFDRKESSVPSDRFYDDFSLQFNYLDQDTTYPEYFYYSLTAESAQQTRPDIYTGRIRPTDCNGTSRYEKLRKYLEKVVAEKKNPNPLDQILYFSGNGFISESMVARVDEKATLYEHFPWLQTQQNGISYIDHKRDTYIKFRLMNEMMRPDLDFAVLHHHGDWNTEYLNNLPLTNSTTAEIESVKLYLRESLRHARQKNMSVDSARMKLIRKFGVPESWFEGSFDPEVQEKDSIHLYNLDLYLSDFVIYKPNCRFVILDACFNGAFHKEDCIANEYIFSEGKTIAVLANSVNVLQDKWVDRNVGLVGMGMNAGNLVKYGPYLEAHLIGDPTFSFRSVPGMDINVLLRKNDPKAWQKLMTEKQYPALQAMAIEQLFRAGKLSSEELFALFCQGTSHQVRMQTLVNLSECRDDYFIRCLELATDDSYEMVERFAVNMLAKSGDERLIPALIAAAIKNNTSERIEFSIKQAIPMFETEKLMAEFERRYPGTNYMEAGKVRKQIAHSVEYNSKKWIESMETILDRETSEKKRMQEIRSMRNYHVHFMVPRLLEYLRACNDPKVQTAMLEAFGWFRLSVYRHEIAATAKTMSERADLLPAVKAEALKTYNRLRE